MPIFYEMCLKMLSATMMFTPSPHCRFSRRSGVARNNVGMVSHRGGNRAAAFSPWSGAVARYAAGVAQRPGVLVTRHVGREPAPAR